MLIKSLWSKNHLKYLEDSFNMLRKYWMKLNLLKYAFWSHVREIFSGFMVTQLGIEVNLDKLWTLLKRDLQQNLMKYNMKGCSLK